MPNKVVLETATSGETFDLSDEKLGEKVVLDYGSGSHLHVTPYGGETGGDVLRRAHEACVKLGISPEDVEISDDASLYADDYDPQACLRC